MTGLYMYGSGSFGCNFNGTLRFSVKSGSTIFAPGSMLLFEP